jgi:GNAT superfamily N-acetyltransferase
MSIVIRRLPADGLRRFAEIDRSEEIYVHYRQVGEELIEEAVSDSVPDFFREGEHHSIPELVTTWQPVVDAGGVLLGAFDGDVIAGLALLGTELAPGVVQVALVYVSRPYRRRGVASALMDEMEQLARDGGARALYVSAVPSNQTLAGAFREGAGGHPHALPALAVVSSETPTRLGPRRRGRFASARRSCLE